MKKIITMVLIVASFCVLSACAQKKQENKLKTNSEMKSKTEKRTLVAYFSRADENYSVGYIKKGNTEIIAEMIAKETSADMFHIETVKAYPKEYNQCIEEVKNERNANARPEIKGNIKIEDYDVIFIGYPIWWGEPPMAVYTFIEKHDWQGKTVIPFCTHEGSGLGDTESNIGKACKGATLLEGFAENGNIAQKNRAKAQKDVQRWIEKLNI